MAAKINAIAKDEAALQVGLAGVSVQRAANAAEAEALLTAELEGDAQLVIVDEAYRSQFSEWFSAKLAKHNRLPLVIFCPAFAEEDPGTDAYINSIVKPAVGFEIRLD